MADLGCDIPQMEGMPQTARFAPCIEPHPDPCIPTKDEFVCHSMGEQREHYLKQIKKLLEKLENEECEQKEIKPKISVVRPMIKYPGYLDIESPKFREPFFKPLVTHIPTKATQLNIDTSHIDEVDKECPAKFERTYCKPWELPRQKSFELRGSIMYKGCDCEKHNGLQDNCRRLECFGSPACLTSPFPTCETSLAFVTPPPQRPVNSMVQEVIKINPQRNKTYCCCDPTPAKEDCQEVNVQCYKCKM